MLSDREAAFAAEQAALPDGTVYIRVSGEVDAMASCELMDVLISGIASSRTLIVDLSSVTLIDDTGMAALAVADGIAVIHGGELRVVRCTGEAEHLLTTIKSGLTDLPGFEW